MTAQPTQEAAFKLKVEEVELDFSHLEPLELICVTESRPGGARISVRFSNHCFSEAHDAEKHAGQVVIADGGKQRAFCPVRYKLSLGLPDLVKALPESHVYLTPEANFVRVQIAEEGEYRMYFNIRKAGADGFDLRMYVESAYRPDEDVLATHRMQKVRFKVLVDKLLKNEKVKFKPR